MCPSAQAEEPDLKFGIFSAFHTVVSSGLQTDDVLEETNKEARQKGNGKFLEQGMSLVRVDLGEVSAFSYCNIQSKYRAKWIGWFGLRRAK